MYIEDEVRALRSEVAQLAKLIRKQAPGPEPEATYVAGGTGKAIRVSEMPTRYIRNVLDCDDWRVVLGVRKALEAELRRRGEG